MLVLILLGAGLVLWLVLGYSYVAQRQRLLDHAVREGGALAQSVASQIEATLGRAEATVRQTGLTLAGRELRRVESTELIRSTLEANPAMFGMAVALNPAALAGSDFQILYGWREGAGITVADRPAPEEDYRSDWYGEPCKLKQPVWIEPYYDVQANATMVTYSVPVMRGGEVAAVITCDLSLAGIRGLLASLELGEGGMAVLLSTRGTFIAHPDHSDIEMKQTIFSLADSQADPEVGRSLHELGKRMLSGQPGHMSYRRPFGDTMSVAHMNYRTIPCTGWAFGIFQPEAQVLAPLVRLNRISMLVAVGSLVLLLIPALGIAWSITRPLQLLANATERLATGDFDAALPPVRRHDEVAQLTEAFEQMRRDLRHYIADLTATTAVKERMAGELSAAREIQMSIVPKLFPPLPNRPDIDLYAMLIPAQEVGGDLYDFALLDEEHLYIAIGDVSGKGIPASLLMAVGKTLMKSTVQTVRTPGRALAHVNNELAEDNESCMFITMFCGILNLKTGDFIYANAGHNPPLLVRQDGSIEALDERPSPALGACLGASYPNHSRHLKPGDLLVLYTDGVTEAMSPGNEMFGDDGLLDFVRREGHLDAKPLLEKMALAVQAHAAGAAQSDDITALVVRYRATVAAPVELTEGVSRPPDAILNLRNHLGEFPLLVTWIEEQGSVLKWPPPLVANLNLALEEWVVNVIQYGYEDDLEHRIELRLWHSADEVRVVIEDDGRPFDPTAQAEADTSLPVAERPIGGLGIHFIRKTMDRFTYRRKDGRNIVTLVKAIDSKPQEQGEPAPC
jgi:sigma-B regulation protein RsbU (phosphoserine phosphatase)